MRQMYSHWYKYEDGYAHLVYSDSVSQDYDPELAAMNQDKWKIHMLGMERTLCGLILAFSNEVVHEPFKRTCVRCQHVAIMLELSS